MTKIVDYNCFKASLTMLERLQEFKVPFTKLYEQVIFSYGVLDISDDFNCEFHLIDGGDKEEQIQKYIESVKDIDEELEIVALKLAKLLEKKENDLKDNLIQFTKK